MLYFVGYFLVLPAGTGVCAEVERDKLPEAPPATAEKCSIAEMGGASFKEKIHKVPHGNDSVVSAGSQLWPLRAGERV